MDSGSYENVQDTQKVHKSKEDVTPAPTDALIDINMEASVTPDEVMRAGGFGATDNISSLLPVASDFTDFEAHLREDQDYKDLEDQIPRGNPVKEQEPSDPKGGSRKVDMEASVVFDEVTRAGGFGARDDISSFLPVASDFTDFEAHLRDARDYEGVSEEISRPGLGWTNK